MNGNGLGLQRKRENGIGVIEITVCDPNTLAHNAHEYNVVVISLPRTRTDEHYSIVANTRLTWTHM